MTPNEELAEAWARVLTDRGTRGDGERIALWLRREVLKVLPLGAPTCAVHDSEGRRRLAAEILQFVPEDQPIDDAAEHRDARSDLALQRAGRAAGIGPGSRGARRRVPG